MLTKIEELIVRFILWITIGLFVILCSVTFLQVVFRYVFNNALYWSEELVRYTFVWITFFGFNLVIYRRSEMGVSFFSDLMSTKLQRILNTVSTAIIMIFLVILFKEGINLSLESTFVLTIALQIPWTYVYLAVPVGCFFMILLYGIRMVRLVFVPDDENDYSDSTTDNDMRLL